MSIEQTYYEWHQDSVHHHVHWGILVVVSLVVGILLVGEINRTYLVNFSATEAQAATSLLQTSDITCAGVFLTPAVSDVGGSGYPVAMRYEGASRHYFIYAGDKHVVEFPEPVLSPCNTPISGVTRASLESWGGDWGTFNVAAGDNFIPGLGATYASGLSYDNVTSQLILNWTNTYSVSPPHNSFAAVTLDNTTHTMNRVGCWGLTSIIPNQTAGGVLSIPNSFVSAHLPAGARWAVGFGGATGSYVGLSLGPTLFAITPPSGNPCTPTTDTFIGNGTTLAQYGQNNVGPYCTVLGCTPTQAPTAPYPAKLALNTYSKAMYQPDWEPYDGHGWFGFATAFSMGWYDDGVKQGIVVPIMAPEGWANTTVRASPAPFFDNPSKQYYQTGTMYLASTSTHDGNNINPGDKIWIQSCTPGVESGCETGNMRHFSTAVADSVVPSTGRVDFHILDSDFSAGSHVPVVGGAVYHGCVYAHGMPDCSRGVYLLQIYDPAQYAEVIHGTRQPYDVVYNQEIDLTSMVPGFGCPSCGFGVQFGSSNHHPTSVMTDPLAHQFMIAFKNPGNPLYAVSDAIYVFNVGPNAVTPPVASPGVPATPSTPSTPATPSTPSTPAVPGNCVRTATVTDANGDVWTIGASQATLKNGVRADNGSGSVYTLYSNSVYVLGTDSKWYKWLGTSWQQYGPSEPSCPVVSPAPAPITGDLDGNGQVNSLDWGIMRLAWFTSNAQADLNRDGIVNSIDFSILNRNWFRSN